jgi:hypothetical protein
MANEYLKRTPTSTGNRKKWTWAGWIKINKDFGSSQYNTVWSVAAGTSSDNSDRFHLYHFSDGRWGTTGTSSFSAVFTGPGGSAANSRDPGSWMHICLSVDTTISSLTPDKIQRFWINGMEYIYDDVGNISQNADLAINGPYEHYIGTRNTGGNPRSFDGQMFDLYLVDGQALTPDVFGFYKDGDGYQSSGTTQATDFKPGQWSPRLPKSIKYTINRSGGFGANGFYLPMNDSSNPGADFHCAPNSIIKLKGEDLPQPRNGAPTTSDAYVSQLRTDPFAANLILACPFVAGGFGQDGAVSSTIPGLGDYHIALGGPSSVPAVNWLIASGNQAKITGDKGLYYGSSLDVTNNSICPRATVGTAFTPDGDYTVEFWCYINSFDSVGSHVIQYDQDNGNTGWLVSVDGGTLRWMLRNSSNQDVQVSIPNVVKLGQWNHIACVYETTPKDRITAWVNGVSVGTTAVTSNYLSTQYTNLNRLHIGSNGGDGTRPMQGYLQDLRIYKGVAKYKGGFDVSKPYTPVGIEPFRTTADTCKNNFATLNPIFGIGRQDQLTYTNGNLTVTSGATGGSDTTAVSNTAIKDKVYCEFYLPSDAIGVYVGAAKYNTPFANGIDTTASSDCWLVRGDTGNKANGESGTGLSYGGSFSNGDVIMMAADIENGSIWWGRNGSWTASGNPATNSNAAYTNLPSTEDLLVMCGDNYSDKVPSIHVNFGQDQTFANLKAVNKNRVNNGTGNDVWHQSSNGGTHVDWTVSSGGTAISVNVPSGNYARAWLLASDGTIDPKKTYLLSFKYVSGPANLGVQNDQGYMTAIDGSVAPSGLSSGNYYSFIIQGTREFNFTGFSGSNYSLDEIVVSEIDECYTDDNGIGKFHYEPPTGFLALCEDNLPTPTIADPGEHFKCVLYKGSGTSRGITGVGFKPDLVWVKSRTNTEGHILFDSVRGPELRQLVMINTTEGLVTNGGLMSFDDDGFGVGQYTGTNQSGQDYVAWCWKAGGAAVANTNGTIASQVSVNQTAGFSCGTFTGNLQANQSIGHGLGKVPAMVVVKERNANSGWAVYHKARGNTKVSYWDIPNTEFTETNSTASWGPTDPTSDVFYVGANGATNDNNLSFYAWAEVEGFSKFGSYVGNSDDDGPVIWCGFKPAFLMIKLVTGSERDWHIYDSSRNPTNPVGLNLRPSTDASEIDEPGIDFLSNGFKIRKDYVFSNESGQTIIFMAFAESPFQTANAK